MHPEHCFCHYALEELQPWVEKRYRENIETVELLSSTEDLHERELIGIVGMFDVKEELMLELMGDVGMPEHHIIHCRENVKKLLAVQKKK